MSLGVLRKEKKYSYYDKRCTLTRSPKFIATVCTSAGTACHPNLERTKYLIFLFFQHHGEQTIVTHIQSSTKQLSLYTREHPFIALLRSTAQYKCCCNSDERRHANECSIYNKCTPQETNETHFIGEPCPYIHGYLWTSKMLKPSLYACPPND